MYYADFFSGSSRFTDSSKYEDQFQSCFKLEEERVGEICNACVLLVKRWKKLPKNTKRNWSHVVDARAGPGGKSFVKQKKKEEHNMEEFDKIRKKLYDKKSSRTEEDLSVASPESPMLYEETKPDCGGEWRGEFYPDYCEIMICRIYYFISKTERESIIRLLRLLLLEKVGN